MIKNLYKELEVKENATQGEIKSSYRRLVKQHHPDAGGEKDRFLAIRLVHFIGHNTTRQSTAISGGLIRHLHSLSLSLPKQF